MVYFGKSDTGRRRATNQDCFATVELGGGALLAVVCDGMGGAAGGNIAAETASRVFCGYIARNYPKKSDEPGPLLRAAAEEANTAVYEAAQKDASLTGMGTTLAAALIKGDSLHIANIGDSRLYIIDSEIKKITRDHSFVQYLVDIGQLTPEEAASSPHRNIITRAVGSDRTVQTDIYSVDIGGGGAKYILLCSDGLTNFVREEEIFAVLTSKETAALQQKVSALIDLANKAGGGDNITALVIEPAGVSGAGGGKTA